jgi:branched-chain amino acid transport system permease protein
VATIGLSQLLTVAALALPFLWGQDPLSGTVPVPFDFKFTVAPITFDANELLALIVAPIALAGVAIFLRSTSAGVAIRASAERADRAYLLGVPVKRLQTLVWIIAAVLSFIGVFLRAGVSGLPFAANDGFGTTSFGALLIALAALTLGRFTNLPSIALSAVALGILEQCVIWNNGNNPDIVYPVMAVVIIGGLLWRKTGQSRTEHDSASTWSSVGEVRRIPRELRSIPEVAAAKWGGALLLVFLLVRLPTFGFMGEDMLLKAGAVVIFAIIGISIIVLTGWAGQVTLGQMAFVGVGAAVGAVATVDWHLDLSVSLLLCGACAAVVAVVVGLPALRVRGLFLGVTTLAFAITCSNYLLNPQYMTWIPQGANARVAPRPLFGRWSLDSYAHLYWLCLAVLGLAILAVAGLRRSRTGRALIAQRENERAAQSYGINLARAKLLSFAISGFLAGVAGDLFVHLNHSFTSDQFGAANSFTAFTSTVVGGLGSITGAIIGAVFSRGGTWFLHGAWQILPSAIGVLVVLLVFPDGLGGIVFRLRDLWLRNVAHRNDLVVPSLVADTKVVVDVGTEAEEIAAELGVDVPHLDTDGVDAAGVPVVVSGVGPPDLSGPPDPTGPTGPTEGAEASRQTAAAGRLEDGTR